MLIFIFREENLLKISRRVKEYKVEILNPPREGKKLLVLDVDYTLFGKYYSKPLFLFNFLPCTLDILVQVSIDMHETLKPMYS